MHTLLCFFWLQHDFAVVLRLFSGGLYIEIFWLPDVLLFWSMLNPFRYLAVLGQFGPTLASSAAVYSFVVCSLAFFQVCISTGSFVWFSLESVMLFLAQARLYLIGLLTYGLTLAEQAILNLVDGVGYASSTFYTPKVSLLHEGFSFFGTYSFLPNFAVLFYFVSVSTLIALLLFTLPWVLKPAVSGFEKNSSYECGFEPFVCKNEVFESHFLVVGVLFLLFDLELIFLFPLGVVAPTYDYTVPLAVFPFLMVLLLGFVFEWLRGALLWPVFYSKRTSAF